MAFDAQFSVLLTLSASCNHSNCLHLTTTSHYYLDIVDVDCPVVLLTVFMTALLSSHLRKWFLLEKKPMCLWHKNVLKLSWKVVKSRSWNFTLSCWWPLSVCLLHVHIDVLSLYQDRVIGTNLTSTTTADSSGSGCQLESAGKNSGDFVEGN